MWLRGLLKGMAPESTSIIKVQGVLRWRLAVIQLELILARKDMWEYVAYYVESL